MEEQDIENGLVIPENGYSKLLCLKFGIVASSLIIIAVILYMYD